MTRGRDWDPKEHPRWPEGAGDKGGEFRDKGAPGGDWASRISDAMVAPRATALKPARPAKRAPASKLKVGQVRQAGLPDGYEMYQGDPDFRGNPTWDVRTAEGEHAFSIQEAEETRDKLQGRIAVSRKTVTGYKAVISQTQNRQFDIRDSRSYSSPTARPFYTESKGSLASTRKQAVEDGVRMHRELYVGRGRRQMETGGPESVSDHDLGMVAEHGHWPINQEARKEQERRATAKPHEPEMVEIPLRGGDTLMVERQVKDEVPAHIQEATAQFQRGEIAAGQLAAILEGREPTPMPKLTPKAAKFLAEYRLNSRLNPGERIPIQLTREGLVKVRTGKNGLGMKERWLEVTPAGRDVQQLLQNATPKKATGAKLRKSLRPGDVVEWTDDQDNTTLRGTVRREGRFTMVDWEGGRAEKVSARGTDPSIRKISDAPADYVQPETTPPKAGDQSSMINLDDVMKDAGLMLDHNYTNRSAYLAVRGAREKLQRGEAIEDVAAWLRGQAAELTSDEDDQTSKLQMDKGTLRERLRSGKRLLRDLAKALIAAEASQSNQARGSDWVSRVDASMKAARG